MQIKETEKVTAPWRRFFARSFDLSVYSVIWNTFLTLAVNLHLESRTGLSWTLAELIASACLMFLMEPALLTLTGTTPGKFLFGIHVSGTDGDRLPYGMALARTWGVFGKGMGYFIPGYQLFRQYRSYKECKNGEMLYWETDSVLCLDRRFLPARAAVYLASFAVFAGVNFWINQFGSVPVHRGDITVAEYCENFNRLQNYYGIKAPLNYPQEGPALAMVETGGRSAAMYLKEDGTWEEKDSMMMFASIGQPELPRIQFTEENGVMTGMHFTISCPDGNLLIPSYVELLSLCSLSWICAQEDYSVFSMPPYKIREKVMDNAKFFEDFSIVSSGAAVDCKMGYEGYSYACDSYSYRYLSDLYETNFLVPDQETGAAFTLEFSLEKEKESCTN